MNVHLSIRMKGLVSSPVVDEMKIIIIIIMTVYAATFFFGPNFFGAKAYAQENNNNNNTLILEDIRAILRDQQRNMTPAQLETLNEINDSSTKFAIQGAYTALSVFFLGIGLVIFGLRMTTKVSPQLGRRFTLMVWALTLPVIILVGLFQYGEITGNTALALFESEEPYFILTFLLYIPIGILLFLLFEQKAIVAAEAENTARQKKGDRIHEIEKLVELKERGVITEEEFQKLKTELLAKL
jgi:amino acid transporter